MMSASVCMSACVYVCVFVCPRSYLCRGSILLWRHSDTLHISAFKYDVIFAHKLRLLNVAARLRQ